MNARDEQMINANFKSLKEDMVEVIKKLNKIKKRLDRHCLC